MSDGEIFAVGFVGYDHFGCCVFVICRRVSS